MHMDVAMLCLFLAVKVHAGCMWAAEHTGSGTCTGMWVDALVARCAYMWMQAGGKQRSKNSSVNLHVCNIGSGTEALNQELILLGWLASELERSPYLGFSNAEFPGISSAFLHDC